MFDGGNLTEREDYLRGGGLFNLLWNASINIKKGRGRNRQK